MKEVETSEGQDNATHIHLIAAPEGENRMSRAEITLKQMTTQKFAELNKVTNPQIQEAKLILSKMN